MGNSSSSARGHHDDTVDFGSLVSQGVYTGPQDWNQAIAAQLIVQRKLAPFYRPLEEYDESWDDEQILASRKELPENTETASHSETASATSSSKPDVGSSFRSHGKRPSTQKEAAKLSEAVVYRGAVECPICFLVRLVYSLSMLVRLTPFFFFLFNFLSAMPFWIRRFTDSCQIHVSILTPLRNRGNTRFFCHIRGRFSIIPRTSTTRGVATKRYARNAFSRSSDPSRPQLIWFPNLRLVLTACRSILGWCTPRLLGGLGSVATVRYAFSFVPPTSVSRFLTPYLPDAPFVAGFSQGGISIIRGPGNAVTSP